MGRGTHAIESPFAGGVTGRRRDSLGSILARDATRAVFQPIVELDTGAVVGFEALARGPAGSPLARPDAMFDAARAGDLVAELDWTCRATRLGLVGTAGHAGDDEVDVVVLGPHFSAALVARDAPDGGLDFAVTHDRELVEDCARALIERLEPSLTRD